MRSSAKKASPAPPTPKAAPLFTEGVNYYIGVWRRTPYDVFAFPTALNGASDRAVLKGYESDGSLWNIRKSDSQAGAFSVILECVDAAERVFLRSDLTCTTKSMEAAVWSCERVPTFRGGPGDIGVELRLADRPGGKPGLLLCSNEQDSSVLLLSEQAADEKDEQQQYKYNRAWEVTPDGADGDDSWLDRYME
eukprot:TRINITY_DN2909_c0_g1_i1.p1 TRINITY_DN2909_c0_g1~~TRINITY_DN2909_c0_g1_i1.p1  ORF type:complete len:193 (+),score=20.77 TRINITY_DN2909_c0_g1_i1:161-739(+)